MDLSRSPSAAQTRAHAVSVLRRAASLPRMKDGRRPPMHVDGASEGEHTPALQVTGSNYGGSETSLGEQLATVDRALVAQLTESEPAVFKALAAQSIQPSDKPSVIDLSMDVDSVDSPAPENLVSTEASVDVLPSAKRRSRSRSRNSRDLKGKARMAQTMTPNPFLNDNESEQDELETKIVSPRPSYHEKLVPGNILDTSKLAFPESPFAYAGSSPGTPTLPSLEALGNAHQKGLFRSNSAAARMMAMHKLTGGADTYDEAATVPTLMSLLTRNNTVAGGERSTARNHMLRRLGERVKDGQNASGTESPQPISLEDLTSAIPKRRRRRSRRSSTGTTPNTLNVNLPDVEPPHSATLPVTQNFPPSPLPEEAFAGPLRAPSANPSLQQVPTPDLADARALGTPPTDASSRNASPAVTPSMQRSVGSQGSGEIPRKRRSVFIEPEDDPPDAPAVASTTPPIAFMSSRNTPDGGPRVSGLIHEQPSSRNRSPILVANYTPSYTPPRMANGSSPPITNAFSSPITERVSLDEEVEEQVVYNQVDKLARSRPEISLNEFEEHVVSPSDGSRAPSVVDEDADESEGDARHQYTVGESIIADYEAPREDVYEQVDGREPWQEAVDETANDPYEEPHADEDTRMSEHIVPDPEPVVPRSSYGSEAARSVPSRMPSDKSLARSYNEWDERRALRQGSPTAKNSTTWDKVKSTFSRSNSITTSLSRSNSAAGRRSRAGSSIRRDHTDSSISRESDNYSFKNEAVDGGIFASSASNSIMSLGVPAASAPGSHFPPPSSADVAAKYSNSKLFPFPGMKQLEEERRNRPKPFSEPVAKPEASALIPDDVLDISPSGLPRSTSDLSVPLENSRSVSLLSSTLDEYIDPMQPTQQISLPSQIVSTPNSTSQDNYFDTPKKTSGDPSAPRNGVRRWFSNRKPNQPSIESSLGGNASEFKKTGSDHATSSTSQPPLVPHAPAPVPLQSTRHPIPPSYDSPAETDAQPNQYLSSTTPDPAESPSDYQLDRSGSNTTLSSMSSAEPAKPTVEQSVGDVVLQRLDEMFSHGARSPTWSRLIDDPPRKLILSSPVVQVVDTTDTRERFLMLFTDVLVIAGQVPLNINSPLDSTKPDPMDRKVVVKSVTQLKYVKHTSDRDDSLRRSPSYSTSTRHPLLRAFVLQFVKDQDYAISTLFQKSGKPETPSMIGHLLARTVDLDKAQLGEYLCRRKSRATLHAFLDHFGFAGVRVDFAIRTLLHSVWVPQTSRVAAADTSPMDALLDGFSSRWYDANKEIVPYDSQMAFRIVRAIVQLNLVLHGGVADEAGPTTHARNRLAKADFISAFRTHDAKHLMTDKFLSTIYEAIKSERLVQGRHPDTQGDEDIPIILKKGPPTRLTLDERSEPIIVKLPRPDPTLTISLHGGDLVFDPPVLSFAKSAEASFRVTGTKLGTRTIVLVREGPNAILYTGLPRSSSVVIERAFMRNTFSVAFFNQNGKKRKYMFSVNDHLLRHQWCVSLSRQINLASSMSPHVPNFGTSVFSAAAERVSFRVLQDTLLGTGKEPRSPIDEALDRLVSTSPGSPQYSTTMPKTGPRNAKDQRRGMTFFGKASPLGYFPQSPTEPEPTAPPAPPRLWSVRDLQMICQQNSSIPLILSYLQLTPNDS